MEMIRKISRILSGKQKAKVGLLIVMMLIGAFLEAMGIAMIIPVITSIIDPAMIEMNRLHLGDIYRLIGAQSVRQFAVVMMVGIIVVFILKNVYLFFENVVLLRFIYTNQFETSRRMMIGFMRRPYEYYLGADTAVIQRNITSDINNVFALILTILQMTSEIIVFIFLVLVLLYSDWKMTLFVAVILVAILFLIKSVIKPVMRKAGTDNQNYYSGLYKWIQESVMAIKEIKIAGREDYFIEGYAKCGDGYVNAVQKYKIFNSTPRLLIETVFITGLIGYMLIMLKIGVREQDLVTQLGLFAAASSRLLPSANRINNYLTSISYFEPFLNNVSANLQEEINDSEISYERSEAAANNRQFVEKLPVKEKIELKDITYRYPNTEPLIFDHADMTIPVGRSVGIVGTSGAGKTTIVDIMLGLLRTESGEVLADGVPVTEHYQGWLKNIGYIPQTIFMLDSDIRHNVAFGVPEEEIDDEKVWNALKEAQLDEHVRSLPDGLQTGIGERGIRISGGQRQRIGIARALYEDPEVLVLDEATSAVDNETEAAIMDSINRLHGRKTLIIIAHRLQTIEKCDMVYRVKDGKVVVER